MARVPRNALPAILLGSGALLTLACTTPTELSEQMLPSLQAGDNTVALEILDENAEDYGEDNAFLYLIERGMVLHYAGRWQESNQSFERAKRVAEEHYTKSLTQEASTFLVNDSSRPYYGENFERALLHVFGALNYNELGDTEGALVEVRQLSFFLRQLDLEAENTLTYRDDAFARYLAGIFFAERGEHDQAFVAYKKALDLYKHYEKEYRVSTPGMLVTDAALTARELGSWAERELEAKVGRYEVPERRPGTGRAVVLHYNGRAPYKIDTFIDIAFGDGWVYVNHVKADGEAKKKFAKASGYATAIAAQEQVRVAFPEYRSVPKTIRFMGWPRSHSV